MALKNIIIKNKTDESVHRANQVIPPNGEIGPIKVSEYQYREFNSCVHLNVSEIEDKTIEEYEDNTETEETDSGGSLKNEETTESKEEEPEVKDFDFDIENLTIEDIEDFSDEELKSLGAELEVEHYWVKNQETLIEDIQAKLGE